MQKFYGLREYDLLILQQVRAVLMSGIFVIEEEVLSALDHTRLDIFFSFLVVRRKEQFPNIINVIFFLESAFGV